MLNNMRRLLLLLLLYSTPIQHYLTAVTSTHEIDDTRKLDFYEFRHVVAEGVQKALDECRQRFKLDRWDCPKKAFTDILSREPLPSNKELALVRAMIASGTVLSIVQSCSYGKNNICGCGNSESKFDWNGCNEVIKFGFKTAKMYLDSQDIMHDEASRIINAHNYQVGRHAVIRKMKKRCKCHGVSGACQINTCWTVLPDMSEVGSYLKRQYRIAAKVGAMTAAETNVSTLNKELAAISMDKLVFADASPDYCYEEPKLGINGTLGRYCSRAKHRPDGTEVSRYEKDSCDRLCTKCGYRIKKERLNVEKQCDCRFVYCCSVECKRCPHVEETFKCVRHS